MATNEKVGSIYHVAIGAVGYMLADRPERKVGRQAGILDTQPPGSDDTFERRIGRYDFIAQTDWTGGEGQEMDDRPESDSTRYFYSEGVDPFSTPGQLACLPLTASANASTFATQRVITTHGGPLLYHQSSSTELTQVVGANVTFTAVGSGSITGLATDGEFWYAANDSAIRRNNAAADPGSDWSTVNAGTIAWIGDRLAALTANTPPEFTTLDSTGTEENAGGWVSHPDAKVEGLCGGDGYAWWGVISPDGSNISHVHYWQVDSDPINHGVALVLPPGEIVTEMFFYLGNVFIRAARGTTTGVLVKIYRCVNNGDGALTPFAVVEEEMPTAGEPGGFAGVGKFVAFGWPSMQRTGENGIGVIDLETGGVARWHVSSATTAAQVYVSHFIDDFAFTVGGTGGGVFTVSSGGEFRTGFAETSIRDLATPVLKHLDEIRASFLPLAAGTSLDVDYSTDGGSSYNTGIDSADQGTGQTSTFIAFGATTRAPSFRFRVTLNPSGTDTPTLTALIAKTHATNIADEIIVLPINCNDVIADVTGTTIAEDSGPGKGLERYRTLRDAVGETTEFQDVDWPDTNLTRFYEVVAVDESSWGAYSPNRARRDEVDNVALVTLRRAYSP